MTPSERPVCKFLGGLYAEHRQQFLPHSAQAHGPTRVLPSLTVQEIMAHMLTLLTRVRVNIE